MAPQAFQPAESFSLNDILHQHCRDRLYVQPLHWTDQHLQLLGCRFVRRQRTPQPASSTLARLTPPSESESKQSREDSKANKHPPKHGQDTDLKDAVDRIVYYRDSIVKEGGLIRLLKALSNNSIITSFVNFLDFYYGGRKVAKLPCSFFGRVINNIPTPFLAYVDYNDVAHLRKDSIFNRRSSLPYRLQNATLARLKPTNIDQDPYLASILIALAQVQQHDLSDDTTVHLLVTNGYKTEFVRVYTATVAAAFLRKLDKPSVFSESSLIIRYASIPPSHLKQEIAAIVELSRGKKRPRESSIITEQVACKQKKEVGDGSRGEETA